MRSTPDAGSRVSVVRGGGDRCAARVASRSSSGPGYAFPESLLPDGSDLDLVSARVCTFAWTEVSDNGYTYVLAHSAPLTAAEVDRLNTGFAAEARPVGPDHDFGDGIGGEAQSIVGVTAWGDTVQLEYLGGELMRFRSPAYPDSESVGWHLKPDDAARLGLAAG